MHYAIGDANVLNKIDINVLPFKLCSAILASKTNGGATASNNLSDHLCCKIRKALLVDGFSGGLLRKMHQPYTSGDAAKVSVYLSNV